MSATRTHIEPARTLRDTGAVPVPTPLGGAGGASGGWYTRELQVGGQVVVVKPSFVARAVERGVSGSGSGGGGGEDPRPTGYYVEIFEVSYGKRRRLHLLGHIERDIAHRLMPWLVDGGGTT